MLLAVAVLLVFKTCSGFMIVEAEPGLLVVAPGETVTLMCRVDDHYEWCKWHHPGGEFCDFEWKRKQDNITMQECEQLRNRVGSYNIFNDFHHIRLLLQRSKILVDDMWRIIMV